MPANKHSGEPSRALARNTRRKSKSKRSKKSRAKANKKLEVVDGGLESVAVGIRRLGSVDQDEPKEPELPFEVPIIDFGNIATDKGTQDLLFRGLTDVGFLILDNHGIPQELIDQVHRLSTQFYSATHEQRMRVTNESKIMKHEGSAFTTTPFLNSPDDPEIVLDVAEIDSTFDIYLEKLAAVGLNLLAWCEKVLGLVKGRLTDNYEPAGTIVDALFYDKTPEGKWGTKQHYDNCMMTILMQDDVGGLELRHEGKWYPVKPMAGKFVINFGKMMEHFTYGIIKATLHRVRNTKNKMRVSWPLFLGPNLNRDLIQLIEFKWNEKDYFQVQKERVIEENKEIEENAAHVHLNISEKGHHVWEMIQHKHLQKYRKLLKVQNTKKQKWEK